MGAINVADDILQVFSEGRVDARSLSEFVFKPAGFKVTRRLAPTIDTLQFYIDRFNSLNGDFSSSVSVALSSLNSSVAEADGKVSYIETTVQDAINNTAIEGGVLADTFVTATAYGSGSIARTQREINSERVSVHDFGAIGDGTLHTVAEWTVVGSRIYFPNLAAIQAVYPKVTALTDYIDRVAIQACIDYCQPLGKLAEGVRGKKYTIDKQIDLNCNADFTGSWFTGAATFNGKLVSIDAQSIGTNFFSYIDIKLPIILIPSASGNRPVGSVGLYLQGMRNCDVTFDTINGFENNMHLYSGDGNKYISYNNFFFKGSISGGVNNILIDVEGTGWINECVWYGGQFGTFNGDSAKGNACVRFKKSNSGNNGPNGHLFLGCSMEGSFTNTIAYEFESGITTSYFSTNRWVGCRFEGCKSFIFHPAAMYDLFDGCHISPTGTFVDGVVPLIIGSTRMSNSYIDVASTMGTTRRSVNTHYFGANNTGNALALSAGLSGQINAGITANGSFIVYDPLGSTSLNPVATLKSLNGRGCLSLGSGAEGQTLNNMYSTSQGQVKIDFNMLPVADDTVNLGTYGAAYKNVTSVQLTAQKGISLWGVAAPSSKPSVTGLKTPTTIAEQKVVTDSLIAALASYGLITDSRT